MALAGRTQGKKGVCKKGAKSRVRGKEVWEHWGKDMKFPLRRTGKGANPRKGRRGNSGQKKKSSQGES